MKSGLKGDILCDSMCDILEKKNTGTENRSVVTRDWGWRRSGCKEAGRNSFGGVEPYYILSVVVVTKIYARVKTRKIARENKFYCMYIKNNKK